MRWTFSFARPIRLTPQFSSMSVSGYAISQGSIITDLDAQKELVILGITLFTVTFGTAPLLLAPFSEVYGTHTDSSQTTACLPYYVTGRNGIYLVSAVMFALFFIPQALATNIQTILVTRFIS